MTEKEIFATDIRRYLYMLKILDLQTDALLYSKLANTNIKNKAKSIKNATGGFMNMVKAARPEVWNVVKEELGKDYLHDMSQIIDGCMHLENLGDVVVYLKENTVSA